MEMILLASKHQSSAFNFKPSSRQVQRLLSDNLDVILQQDRKKIENQTGPIDSGPKLPCLSSEMQEKISATLLIMVVAFDLWVNSKYSILQNLTSLSIIFSVSSKSQKNGFFTKMQYPHLQEISRLLITSCTG